MTVFTDDWQQEARVGRLLAVWSHLVCGPFDPPDELHAFAERIGLRRAWYQGPPTHPWPRCHYDVTEPRRRAAIAAGAVQITWRQAGQQMHLARTVWHSVNHGGLICTRTSHGGPPTLADRRAAAAALYELTASQDPVLSPGYRHEPGH
jgi:hypothetical protein